MKTNFSIDLAILFTALSIFVYACGYFYLENYVGFFSYTHQALGFNFQDYLIIGSLQGIGGILFSFVLLLLISLVNTLSNKNITKSFLKGIFYIIFYFIFLVLNIFYYLSIFPIIFFLKKTLALIKLKFPFFSFLSKALFIGSLTVALIVFLFIFQPFKFIFSKTHKLAKKEVNWSDTIDKTNIDNGIHEFLYYYGYLIASYLIVLTTVFYLSGIEKKGTEDAKSQFIKETINIIHIKDDSIDDLFKSNNLKKPKLLKVKFITCGTNKCIVLIESDKKITINFTKQGLVYFNNPYFYRLISNSDYTIIN